MQVCFRKKIFLGIGSNLGNRQLNIIDAFNLLSIHIFDLKTASLYETEPLYNTNQPFFLNTVFSGYTDLDPESLLLLVNSVEAALGRDRTGCVDNKGARIIDIDILLYDNLISDMEKLTIPHPGISERAFVLIPLTEISREIKNPGTGELFSDILKRLHKQDVAFFNSCRYIDKKPKDIINAGN